MWCSMTKNSAKIVTLTPILLLGVFYSFWLRAKMSIGSIPEPGVSDPKSLDMTGHFYMVYAASILLILSVGVLAMKHRELSRNWKLFFVVQLLLVAVLWFTDPQNGINWFLD